jgi:hypothetical protein
LWKLTLGYDNWCSQKFQEDSVLRSPRTNLPIVNFAIEIYEGFCHKKEEAIKTFPPIVVKWPIPCILDEIQQSNSVKHQFGSINMSKILGPPKELVKGNDYFLLTN